MDDKELRNRIIGLGENSFKKSYYPELNNKIEELKLFHQIFEKTNDVVIVIEPTNSNIKYINNSVAKHFWDKGQNIGLPVSNLLGEDFIEKLELFKANELENKVIIEIEHQNKTFALEAILNKLDISDNQAIVAIIRDITSHLQVQKELEDKNKVLEKNNAIIKTINEELLIAKQKAEESDKLKSAFLANMSHEIRTPMNAIVGFSNLLGKPEIKADKKQSYINIINSSSKHLLDIISDIVDISKIEAGQLNIINKEFNLNKVFDELFAQFKMELKRLKPGVELRVKKGLDDSSCLIISDETRFKQLMVNLLSNACKFTSNGFIEFGYRIDKQEKIILYCKDTGIGIEPKNHRKIFERFRQTFKEDQNKYGGTGLGLSILKGILELMNGAIFLESEKGKGAHFWIELPYQSNQNNSTGNHQVKGFDGAYNWENKVLLLAEDEKFNVYYIEEILSNTGIKIIIAKDGKEAIEKFEANPEIDLILMDIKMPFINGFEATKVIKSKKASVPIIAQTAYALAGDKEKALEIGCDDYVSKPLEKDKLLDILVKFL